MGHDCFVLVSKKCFRDDKKMMIVRLQGLYTVTVTAKTLFCAKGLGETPVSLRGTVKRKFLNAALRACFVRKLPNRNYLEIYYRANQPDMAQIVSKSFTSE